MSCTSAAQSSRSGFRRGCSCAKLERQRAHRDGVLEQPAEIRVVAAARARRAPPLRAQRGIAEQRLHQPAVRRVVDLAGQVLEEPLELVEVAVGDREERRPDRRASARRMSRTSSWSSSRKRSTRPTTRTSSPRSKRPATTSASRNTRRADRAGLVAELERQVGRAGAGGQAILARAGEDGVDGVSGAQGGDRGLGVMAVTVPILGDGPDAVRWIHAAAALGTTTGRA